jgi:hypothetical protein
VFEPSLGVLLSPSAADSQSAILKAAHCSVVDSTVERIKRH